MLLRPTFTHYLAKQLLAGKHINLISPHGQGRRRTLADLGFVLPDDVQMFQADLKRDNKWCDSLPHSLQGNNHGVVILHNFDVIEAGQWPWLQDLKQYALLCVSEEPLLAQHDANKFHCISLTLPSISKAELMLEFERRALPLAQGEYAAFADWLLVQDKPYSLLDELDVDWYKKGLWKA